MFKCKIPLRFCCHFNYIYISGPEIGSGQFSTVYIGKYFGDYVAVKKQTREDVNLDSYLLRELAVLKNASHKNLVQYIGACNEIAHSETGLNALYIVTEFCQVSIITVCSLYMYINSTIIGRGSSWTSALRPRVGLEVSY